MEPPFQKKEPSFLARRIDEKYRMKESVTGHRTGLTDRLLKLFAPRQPLEFWAPEVSKPKAVPLSGLAAYTDKFASPGDPEYKTVEVTEAESEPRLFRSPEVQYQARIEVETKPERDIRAAVEAKDRTLAANEAAASERDVSKDPSIEGDPFKTLFVGHLSYEATERKLRREFEEFGPIRRIRIVHDKNTGKPRGYAFIEYENKNDMKQAYKLADGKKIEGRRILVDVERGRTVPGWLPRYMGGGKGGENRATKPGKDPKRLLAQRQIERFLEERAQRRAPPPEALEEDAPLPEHREEESVAREKENEDRRPRSRSRDPEDRGRRDRSRERQRRHSSRERSFDREDDLREREHRSRRERKRASISPEPARYGDAFPEGKRAREAEDEEDSEREAGELPDRASYYEYEDGGRGVNGRSRYDDRKRERDGSYDRHSKRTRERDSGVYV